MTHKILIVEDEQLLRDTLVLNLELEGYTTDNCSDGAVVIEKVTTFKPDLMLLDMMLPSINGADLLKMLRQNNNTIPIIFLTAKNNAQDKIQGLKLGAEDYITKPFELEELLLRIKNVLKRIPLKSDNEVYVFSNSCSINFLTYEVTSLLGTKETLSKREIAFLKLLTLNAQKVISRDEILNSLWTDDENPSARTIDNYILNFRKIFETNQREPKYIQSIRGIGYKFSV